MDYRLEFSKWWLNEFKTIKFPSQGTIFDYFIDPESKRFTPWAEKVPEFNLNPDVPLQVGIPCRLSVVRWFVCYSMGFPWVAPGRPRPWFRFTPWKPQGNCKFQLLFLMSGQPLAL